MSEAQAGTEAHAEQAMIPQPQPGPSWEEQLEQVQLALMEGKDRAERFVRERPGVCIAGALAVGYLVGRFAAKRWLR